MKLRLPAVLLIASCAAFGGDAEFERIVKAIESHYGTHPVHIPFMGLASFVVKVAHPEGAKGLKLAVFEDLQSPPGSPEWTERDRLMTSLCGAGLHSFLRVHSRRSGEATYIFVGPESRSTRLLIATFQRHEATVVEVKADIHKLLRSFEEPANAGHVLTE